MKTPILWKSLFCAATILSLAGCETVKQSKVVRVALIPDSSEWWLTVNGSARTNPLSNATFLPAFSSLHLRQGDVILIDCPPNPQAVSIHVSERAISRYCQSNQVAVYLTHAVPNINIFAIPVFHWSAPYDAPFELAHTAFFREGRFIGQSTNGFEMMLHQIESEHPKQIFILGSSFNTGRSFPLNPVPYEHQRDHLDAVLRATGTDLIQLETLPGF